MKKILAISAAALLLVVGLAPASAATKYSVNQKTLATFSATATGLTSVQKAQVKATVEANPNAEKFICTGIRYYSQPMSVNIMVRKRAKAACEYAKQLNPSLSTWYQNKPTQARSYAGKVLLTVKSQDLRALVTEAGMDSEICKLKENSGPRNKYGSSVATSFPLGATTSKTGPRTGVFNVALVFIEWGDLRGTDADYAYWIDQVEKFEDFYWMVSEGKLNVEVHQEKKWFTVADSYKPYITSNDFSGGDWRSTPTLQPKLDDFVSATDAGVDYSGIDMIIYAIPRAEEVFETGPHDFGTNPGTVANTQEGKIYNWIAPGSWFIDNPGQPSWVFMAHEFGHVLGWADFRDWLEQGKQPNNYQAYIVNPMHGFEIMDNQGGPIRTIVSWLRWLQGWLTDDQITCIDGGAVKDELYKVTQLNKINGTVEALVIKTSATTALVVESRRWDSRFDVPVVHSKDGVIIYTVDSTLGNHEGPLKLLSPRDITKYLKETTTYPDWRTLDAVFYEGDSITVDGLTIKLERMDSAGDIIRVSR